MKKKAKKLRVWKRAAIWVERAYTGNGQLRAIWPTCNIAKNEKRVSEWVFKDLEVVLVDVFERAKK